MIQDFQIYFHPKKTKLELIVRIRQTMILKAIKLLNNSGWNLTKCIFNTAFLEVLLMTRLI